MGVRETLAQLELLGVGPSAPPPNMKIAQWIRESNLIEGVDDPAEDRRSQLAWGWFAKQELTVTSILEVHRLIMKVHLGEEAGRFRTESVAVVDGAGNIIRRCPPWSHVPMLMALWIRKWKLPTGWHDETLAQFCKLAHVDFESIHPFVDGNGRTGRMILQWQRKSAGLKPLLIEADKRSDYYLWFKEEK